MKKLITEWMRSNPRKTMQVRLALSLIGVVAPVAIFRSWTGAIGSILLGVVALMWNIGTIPDYLVQVSRGYGVYAESPWRLPWRKPRS